ncbi:MAG: AAA family ATPase [Pirellulales bacterium]
MKLKIVHFDAYRSLLDARLELEQGCVGLVGINESGKSNVLNAISYLNISKHLSRSDTPKMARERDPCIRFEFSLDDSDYEAIYSHLSDWCAHSCTVLQSNLSQATLVYHVMFDRMDAKEKRFLSIDGLQLRKQVYLLRESPPFDLDYTVNIDGEHVFLSEAPLLDEAAYSHNVDLDRLRSRLSSIDDQIGKINSASSVESQSAADANTNQDASDSRAESSVTESTSDASSQSDGERTLQSTLKAERDEIWQSLEGVRTPELIDEAIQSLAAANEREEEVRSKLAKAKRRLQKKKSAEKTDSEQAVESVDEKNSVEELEDEHELAIADVDRQKQIVTALRRTVSDWYTNAFEASPVSLTFGPDSSLSELLPNVVIWSHTDEYILQGETQFADMEKAHSLEELSRPLVNLFRIGLDIESIENLKSTIDEIQLDGNERSRHQDRINTRVQEYLKSVWPQYDQRISVAIEQERIRVHFSDPACDDPSYYHMQERSQGCQTFISFLLTIGAEAKHGVIRDTVLLLDEPETHLHPSGVRFMLRELIKAADAGNIVVFATHSVFMIDRSKYDRHVIIKKASERTQIERSSSGRIGRFMQEEVLYGALDVDLTKDFNSLTNVNFVFEGIGDALLFSCVYRHGVNEKVRPFPIDGVSFHHGGKCSDIIKWLKARPIQLGSIWIFILDSDTPGRDLRAFIEGRYADFMDSYVRIFRYDLDGSGVADVQLEDLLSEELVVEAIQRAAAKTGEHLESGFSWSGTFGSYFPGVLKSCKNRDVFKGVFKDELNSGIKELVESNRPATILKDRAPRYIEWAKGVIKSVHPNRKKSSPVAADAKSSAKQKVPAVKNGDAT